MVCLPNARDVYSFEIKTISKKYPVYVNGVAYYFKDQAKELASKDLITISTIRAFTQSRQPVVLLPPADLAAGWRNVAITADLLCDPVCFVLIAHRPRQSVAVAICDRQKII